MDVDPRLEEHVRLIRRDARALARKLGVKPSEALLLLLYRELLIANASLAAAVETLNRIHAELREGEHG